MGNIHGDSTAQSISAGSRRSTQDHFRMEEWELRRKRSQYDIYKHRRDNRQVEVYMLEVPLHEDISGYELRKQMQFQGFPQVLHYELMPSSNGYLYQQSSRWFRVVLQRIPLRLNELKELPRQPQAILHETLECYQLIYSRFGSLKVVPEMVGFTESGATRVWLNTNFSRNEPESTDKLDAPENYMVEGIFTVFDPYMKGTANERRKYMTFAESLLFLKDKLARKCEMASHPQEKMVKVGCEGSEQPRGIQRQTVRPINYILVKNPPKKVHIDLVDQQHCNQSGGSQRPIDQKMELRKTNFNYSGNNLRLDSVHTMLGQSRGTAKIGGNPRHAINQLAGLMQSQQPSDIENSPHNSANRPRKDISGNLKVSVSNQPVIRHADTTSANCAGLQHKANVITGPPTISPPRTIIKITPGTNLSTEPVYFLKPTTHISFEHPQQDKSSIERRTIQQLLESNHRQTVLRVQSKNSETLRQHNTSNNSNSSYKQPLITFNITKPAYSATLSPQNQLNQPTASHPEPLAATLNRNINIRPRLRETRYHTTTGNEHIEEDSQRNETLVTKPSMKAMNIEDRQYKPLQFLKVQEKKPVGKPFELFRPIPTTVIRDGSQPKVYFNYTNPAPSKTIEPAQNDVRVNKVERNNSEKKFQPLVPKKASQERKVQTFVESRTVAIQKDESQSSTSTHHHQETRNLEFPSYHTGNRFEELKPTANKIYSERLKDTYLPSTESKLNTTQKKPLKENSLHSSSKRTKYNERESPELRHRAPAMKLEYDQNQKLPPALNTEVRPSVKVFYSYLNDNPLRLTKKMPLATTHNIEPLPLQKISEPRLISESDHSFPEPQPEPELEAEEVGGSVEQDQPNLYPRSIDMNSDEQRIFEEQAYREDALYEDQPVEEDINGHSPEEVPFYQQVCDYYEQASEEPESLVEQQHPVDKFQVLAPNNLVPSSANVIPQKVSTSSLKDEVAAVLYDEHDYEHLQPNRNVSDLYYQHLQFNGRYPSNNASADKNAAPEQRHTSNNKSANASSPTVNPVGVGFNISRRQTTSRIKQILAEEKNKRQVKQHSSYERLLAEKGDAADDLTQYLQRKLEQRQRLQGDRYREEEERRKQTELEPQMEEWVSPPQYEQPQQNHQHEEPEQEKQENYGGFYAQLLPNVFQEDDAVQINAPVSNQDLRASDQPDVLAHQQQNYVHEINRYLANNIGQAAPQPYSGYAHNRQVDTSSRNYEQHYNVPQELTHNQTLNQLNFGYYNNRVGHQYEGHKQPSYDDLRADLKSLLKNSTYRPTEGGSRRSSKEKTIEQKIRQKKSNFAGLKEQAARVLGL